MLHEASLPKERNTGSEEHAQPLSLVTQPSTQCSRAAQNSETKSSCLKRLGTGCCQEWGFNASEGGQIFLQSVPLCVDTLVVPFYRVGEIVVKRVGRVVRQTDAVSVRRSSLHHRPVDETGQL